jgi:chromosome segregation ATPase
VADAPFGKLKNMLPSLGHKKDDHEAKDQPMDEDNSRGEKVSKKQHDVLAQLSIRSQTELDAKILTPSKVKNVGFHTTEEGGYAFKEVEEFHELVVRTVDWYADKLFERDSDVRTLATEVDKYITDFQNMKFEIELLQSSAAANAIDQDESKIDSLEEKILKLERENAHLKSQNELLKTKLNEVQSLDRKEETQVATGGLNNTEREHLEQMEEWAAQVTVLYDQMETSLAETQEQNDALQAEVSALAAKVNDTSGSEELQVTIAELQAQLEASNASYTELQEQFAALEGYVAEAEKYSKDMEEYAQGLAEALETLQAEVASAESVPALQEAAQHAPEPEPEPAAPAYRLPPGVSLDDL